MTDRVSVHQWQSVRIWAVQNDQNNQLDCQKNDQLYWLLCGSEE